MDAPIELEFQQELQPFIEPIVRNQLARFIRLGSLPDTLKQTSIGDIRKAGLNPEELLQINRSLSSSTLDILIKLLPPGNGKSDAKLTPQLTRQDELEIRRWALEIAASEAGPQPIINPLQKLINQAGNDLEDLSAAIVAKGQRFNYGYHPNLNNLREDVASVVGLPIQNPTMLQENRTYATFHCLPVQTESTNLSVNPQGFPRAGLLSPRTDLYIVTGEAHNKEISQMIAETPSLQKLYHGIEIAINQETWIGLLGSRMVKTLTNR